MEESWLSSEKSLLDYVPSEIGEKYLQNLVKRKKPIQCKGIPRKVPSEAILSIVDVDVTYLTHGLHTFPAKFIPQVPKWSITKFSQTSDKILDPFCGSGTTLLEAKLNHRNSFGIDIDPLAKLITKVKTTPLDPKELGETSKSLLEEIRNDEGSEYNIPKMKNIDHWFKKYVQKDLGVIKKHVLNIRDSNIRDFFIVCFSSIVKDASNADPQFLFSVQYSKKMRELDRRGRVVDAYTLFENTLETQVPKMIKFSEKCPKNVFSKVIDFDAKDIDLPDESVDHAITSPPYINAMDYVRSHRLEMYWIDLLAEEKSKIDLQKKFIGTEKVYAEQYNNLNLLEHRELDDALKRIFLRDKKRAYIVYRFFSDMKETFKEVWRVLKPNAIYVVVIGDGVIRKVPIATHRILADIGKDVGFKIVNRFSYILKNRFMRIDRKGEGGLIEYEWITVFEKR